MMCIGGDKKVCLGSMLKLKLECLTAGELESDGDVADALRRFQDITGRGCRKDAQIGGFITGNAACHEGC